MKSVYLFALSVLAVATDSALAQNFQYKISLYADSAQATSIAHDNTPGVLTVFVVHEPTESAVQPLATASMFRIVPSPGFTGVWLAETPSFLFLGTSPTGIIISYTDCVMLPVRVLEVQYTLFGTSEACSYLQVVEHPEQGLSTIDCDFQLQPVVGGKLTINPNETCTPLPVRTSTWGMIKALYR